MQVANFIIGGTEKAGTTSVFSYLSAHPEVTGSKRKETDFFRKSGGTIEEYAEFFPQRPASRVVMEASPGYLGEGEVVAPRIRAMLPDAKLLFILRDPAARMLSSFKFHQARLNIPESLTFSRYLDLCLEYAGEVLAGRDPARTSQRLPLGDWYLKVLLFGCYARYLESYFEHFPAARISVTFYDDLKADPQAYMVRLSAFLGIDDSVWQSADLAPQNVTFSGRSRLLHRGAIWVNDTLEPVLRRAPRLKSAVTGLYKQLNQAQEGYEEMSEQDRSRLAGFYGPHNDQLRELLGTELPPGWQGTRQPEQSRAV